MKAGLIQLCVLVLLVAIATQAHGQTKDWHVSSSIIWNDDDADRAIDDSLSGLNVAAGFELTDYLTLEGLLGYSDINGFCKPGDCYPDQKQLDLSLDLLAYYDRDAVFAPYAMIGVGYLGVDRSFGGNTRSPTASFGLGFKWRLGQSDFSLRGEFRGRHEFDDIKDYDDRLMTLGLQYDFDGPDFGPVSQPSGATSNLWYVGSSIIWTNDDADRALDDSVSGIHVNVGRHLTDNLTVEGLLGYSDITGFCKPGDCYPDQRLLDISANLLAFYDRDAVFAPYVMAGIGYLGKSADEGPQYVRNTGTDNRPTVSFGLGFKWRLGQSPFSIQGEYRSRLAYRSGDTLADGLVTVGLQYHFGAKPQALGVPESDKPKDTDGDGVLDWWDDCPDTPPGVEVTARGCEIKDMSRDADGDRVPDYRDDCPDTPRGAPVGPTGCSLDSDMDGVLTGQDRCPATRAGAEVDEYGCEIEVVAIVDDADGDTVLDRDDRCPGTRAGARVDIYGCEIRDVISLPGVNFESGSDRLLPGAENLMRDAARTLNRYPNLKVEVAGHTDNVGNPRLNLGLSDRRAKTVLDQLVEFGVDPERLTYRGYGSVQPIADNSTAEGRATNRRVELRIIE